jgi:hypothetical protein
MRHIEDEVRGEPVEHYEGSLLRVPGIFYTIAIGASSIIGLSGYLQEPRDILKVLAGAGGALIFSAAYAKKIQTQQKTS